MTKYPLTWPSGWRRTKDGARQRARFRKHSTRLRQSWADPQKSDSYVVRGEVTIAEGTQRVLTALRLLGATGEAIISTNLELRLDGLPRGGQRDPADPGVAVYWKTSARGVHKVMAIDQYDRVADNLAAIAATLEAMRAIERHGGAQILERAFTGFDALPAPNNWWTVLGLGPSATIEQARAAYRHLAIKRHPDQGGSHAAMAELNAAWQQAQTALTS